MSGEPIIVQKYGGSSVADPARLREVAERVSQTVKRGHRVVVVLSAMGRTTDELLALARQINADPPRRELDMLLSAGERIACALLAMALEGLGHRAISFTGSQCGIMTNDRHADARIVEVRPYRVEDELARGRIVIIAGYQGVSYKRDVTTLGRGGTDATAVAMAAALGAEHCEIYSDVDGVYSADPRSVADAEHRDLVSAESMQLLSEFGAKVLNQQAVAYAREHKIRIVARQTSGSTRETVVEWDADDCADVVGIAALEHVARVIPGASVGEPSKGCIVGAADGGLLVSAEDAEDLQACVAELGGTAQTDLSLITVVGQFARSVACWQQSIAALEGQQIVVHHAQRLGRQLALLVDADKATAAVSCLHTELVTNRKLAQG